MIGLKKKRDWRDWIDILIGWPLAVLMLAIILSAIIVNLVSIVFYWKAWLLVGLMLAVIFLLALFVRGYEDNQ